MLRGGAPLILFTMPEMYIDVRIIPTQCFGKTFRKIDGAMLPTGATESDAQIIEPTFGILCDSPLHHVVHIMPESLYVIPARKKTDDFFVPAC